MTKTLKPTEQQNHWVAIVGGGPAGLMAAEVLGAAGVKVHVYDAMPSPGRKFLLAGIGGLNITHSEAHPQFCARYSDRQQALQTMLDTFPAEHLRAWVHDLGVETFVGTSGRVFPKEMKAAPLLRAWLHRLRAQGVSLHARHRWQGWNSEGELVFSTPNGDLQCKPSATILALGGASWPKLGSDGAWVPVLEQQHLKVSPLESANCGFECAWSNYITEKFSGAPIKPVVLKMVDINGNALEKQGEFVLSRHGVEGSLIYAFSKPIREAIGAKGEAIIELDLLPGKNLERVRTALGKSRGGHSLPSHLKSKLGVSGVKLALLHEVLGKVALENFDAVALGLKALPVRLTKPRPLDEAISTAGGVSFENLNAHLMVKHKPGVFVAGEMLDWEAPTGGYLLTACFATGRAAGVGALAWLKSSVPCQPQRS